MGHEGPGLWALGLACASASEKTQPPAGNGLAQGRGRRDGQVQPAGILEGRARSLLGAKRYGGGTSWGPREGDLMVADTRDLGRFLKAI